MVTRRQLARSPEGIRGAVERRGHAEQIAGWRPFSLASQSRGRARTPAQPLILRGQQWHRAGLHEVGYDVRLAQRSTRRQGRSS